jgi:hypothetical protein
MLDALHGLSSVLQRDASRVRHHRIVVSQELRYTDQVNPDPPSVVHILENLCPMRLPPDAELHGAYPFGFNWVSCR